MLNCLYILLYIIRSISSTAVPSTEPAFFISLFSFCESLALMLLPQQMLQKHIVLSNRLMEDKWLKIPQEVQSVLSLLVDSLSVALPVPLESSTTSSLVVLLLCLVYIQNKVIVPAPCQKVVTLWRTETAIIQNKYKTQ